MRKLLSFSLATEIAMAFAVCSCDDLPEQTTQKPSNGDATYVQLSLQFSSQVTSRAANADSSESYTEGESYEANVKNVYLYFFEKTTQDGKDVYVPVDLSTTDTKLYYKTIEVNAESAKESTVEQADATSGKAKVWTIATVELPSDKIKVSTADDPHTYHVYALCNQAYTGTEFKNEEEFLNTSIAVDNTATSSYLVGWDGAFSTNFALPMAARLYKGEVYCEITPTSANSIVNPIKLEYEVERSFARIAFTNSNNSFDVKQSSETIHPSLEQRRNDRRTHLYI